MRRVILICELKCCIQSRAKEQERKKKKKIPSLNKRRLVACGHRAVTRRAQTRSNPYRSFLAGVKIRRKGCKRKDEGHLRERSLRKRVARKKNRDEIKGNSADYFKSRDPGREGSRCVRSASRLRCSRQLRPCGEACRSDLCERSPIALLTMLATRPSNIVLQPN